MNLHFTFRKGEASEAVKKHIEEKASKFQKHVTYPIEVRFTVDAEKLQYTVEIQCHAEHHDLVAKSAAENLYTAIDEAVDKMATQLKKEREKHKGHAAKIHATDVAAAIPHDGKKSR